MGLLQAPLKRVGSVGSKNEAPMPLRGNQLNPITLAGAGQSRLDSENVRKVSFSTFKPAGSAKLPDSGRESQPLSPAVSNLSFTERLAAKKASRGAAILSVEPEAPSSGRKRVQFDANLKEVRTYTPDVSEESGSSSDFLDLTGICDPGHLRPFAASNYPVHFEDERWNTAIKSFGTSKSNLIANGEMVTSFNSSDEGEQPEDVEVVETRFLSVEDCSVKEAQREVKEPSPGRKLLPISDKVISKNDGAIHRSGNSVADPVPLMGPTSPKVDDVNLKLDRDNPADLNILPRRSQKVDDKSNPVAIVNMKTLRMNEDDLLGIDRANENAVNVLTKEPQSVHTPQKLTKETLPEVELDQSGSYQSNPVLGVQKVSDGDIPEVKALQSASPAVHPVAIRERNALEMDSENDGKSTSQQVNKVTYENYPEAAPENESKAEQQLIHDFNAPVKAKRESETEVKPTRGTHSEAKLENENETETEPEPEPELELELADANIGNVTRDTNSQVDVSEESQTEVGLPCKNALPLKSIDPSKKDVVHGLNIEECATSDAKVAGEHQLAADKNSLTTREWLLMKEELECRLNDEKLRLQKWFTEELALIKSKLESDLDQQKAKIVKEEILLRMEDKLSQLVDDKKHHGANIQSAGESASPSQVPKEAGRGELDASVKVEDEGRRCRCESLEKQVAKVEREMQLLKERKLCFSAKKSTSKKNGPVKAQRESWWMQSDESSSTLSSSCSEWRKPLKEPSFSLTSKSRTPPLLRARSFLSKHQMKQMHRKLVTLFAKVKKSLKNQCKMLKMLKMLKKIIEKSLKNDEKIHFN